MYSTLSGRFVSNEGGVAGYVDRIRRKYHAKWGMQMAGMIFQTRSSVPSSQALAYGAACKEKSMGLCFSHQVTMLIFAADTV